MTENLDRDRAILYSDAFLYHILGRSLQSYAGYRTSAFVRHPASLCYIPIPVNGRHSDRV